jgi:hypothetical protein
MSADPFRVHHGMLRTYALLHPAHRSGRGVAWEMDLDSFEALARELRSAAGVTADLDGIEIQCLGIRVTVVERPGVRLVLTAVEA